MALPSALLERRPDIAAAERTMAAAHEQIGIAVAAYYPTLTLSASGGFEATNIAKWFCCPSRFWSLGAQLPEVFFEGGKRRAQVQMTKAQFDSTVASYRQTVLTAFQQVEDNLARVAHSGRGSYRGGSSRQGGGRLARHRDLSIQSGHRRLSDGDHRAGHGVGQ